MKRISSSADRLPTNSISQRMSNISNNSTQTIVKHKSWNKKECGFCVATNISIPYFVSSIKPSLFEKNHHYDVLFKVGGEKHNNNINKQYSNEAQALIVDSAHFNHHYSDHYAFKSRHIGLETHLKLQSRRKMNCGYRRKMNGYSLSLPSLPKKGRFECLFDHSRKQLLTYCDNRFDIFNLQFNDTLKSENEWKWNTLKSRDENLFISKSRMERNSTMSIYCT